MNHELFPSMVCVTLQKPFQTSLRFSNTPSLFKTIFPIQILFLYHINITKKTPHVYSPKKHPPRNSTNDLPQKTLPNNPQSGNKNQSMGGGLPSTPPPTAPPLPHQFTCHGSNLGPVMRVAFALRIQIYPGVVGEPTQPRMTLLRGEESHLQKRGYLRPLC